MVPFGKLGLDWAYWQITNGNGNIADETAAATGAAGPWDGTRPAASRWCSTSSIPRRRATSTQDLGVNHTALTFEYSYADISGLGPANRLHVGDTNWTLGLLIEF